MANESVVSGPSKPSQISDGIQIPMYESMFVKEKSVASILKKLESRLRMPFVLELDFELQQITDLQFALSVENPTDMTEYKNRVVTLRNYVILNRQFMDRQSLAKELISLLPSMAKSASMMALDGFKKNATFKPEMEKMALFESRRQMFELLPKGKS